MLAKEKRDEIVLKTKKPVSSPVKEPGEE